MPNAIKQPVDGPSADVITWSLCWQAAVGRDFLAHPALPPRIRMRLIGAHRHAGRVLVDYLMLPTEIHAIARIRADDAVGSIARAFGNVLSRWVREAHPVRSPVLAGRYRAHRILTSEAMLNEVRMLAWRPVMLGLCATPTHYAHSALRTALGLTPSQGFDARPMLRPHGETIQLARAGLRRCLSGRPSEQERRSWEMSRGLALATGSMGPHPTMARTVGGAAAQLIAAGGTYAIDGALDLLGIWLAAKIDPSRPLDIHRASTSTGARARALVACLAVDHQLCSAAAVARYFGRAKSTLCEQMATCRSRIEDRSIVETPVRRIIEETAALVARRSAGWPPR